MCAQDAKDLVEVKKGFSSPFCGQHAEQYKHGQEKWVEDYKASL
jgi:hypothetical protein